MSLNYLKTGYLGEEIAVNYLKKIGYIVIERNFNVQGIGEIDIIAYHSGILRFIEVKTSEDVDVLSIYHTAKHFDSNKKERIIRAMQRYVFIKRITIPRCVDLLALNISRETKKVQIVLSRNVYIDSI